MRQRGNAISLIKAPCICTRALAAMWGLGLCRCIDKCQKGTFDLNWRNLCIYSWIPFFKNMVLFMFNHSLVPNVPDHVWFTGQKSSYDWYSCFLVKRQRSSIIISIWKGNLGFVTAECTGVRVETGLTRGAVCVMLQCVYRKQRELEAHKILMRQCFSLQDLHQGNIKH